VPEPSEQPAERFDELLPRYYDDALSSDELSELNELLRHSGEHREAFARLGQNQTMIREVMRQETERAHRIVAESEVPTSGPTTSRFPPIARFAAAACLALVAGLAWMVLTPTDDGFATLTEADADVQIVIDGESIEAKVGTRLYGNEVVTTADFPATIRFNDGSTIELQARSSGTFSNRSTGKHVRLGRGALRGNVEPQAKDQPLVIDTPGATATVLGTQFILEANDQSSKLEVTQGSVRFDSRAHPTPVVVEAQQFAVAATGQPLIVRPTPIRTGLVALYTFEEADGLAIRDRSSHPNPLPLQVPTEHATRMVWRGDGLQLNKGVRLESGDPAIKVVDACRRTGQITIEAWITASVAAQGGPARIVTLSRGSQNLIFTLGHGDADASERFRGRISRGRGFSEVATPPGSATTDLTHLVLTCKTGGKLSIYMNGQLSSQSNFSGNFDGWKKNLHLAIGDDPGEARSWTGVIHRVAIYDHAFDADMAQRNHDAGPRP
jgi:ferric-dicitrate binding protein FerR (iron transport regulator)